MMTRPTEDPETKEIGEDHDHNGWKRGTDVRAISLNPPGAAFIRRLALRLLGDKHPS